MWSARCERVESFKRAGVNLGRALVTVWGDKLCKDGAYRADEAYVTQEIGIRKETCR